MHQDITTPYPKSGNDPVAGGHLLRSLMAFLLLLIGLGAGVAAMTSASAAPPYTTEATVTDVSFTQTTIASGGQAELSAAWTLPDNPTPQAGFTIALPPQLAGRGDTFAITARDTGATIGGCVATPTQLQCDLDADYLAANPKDIQGDVTFWVRVLDSVDVETERTYTVGEHQVKATVTPPRSVCTTDCPFDWKLRKDGVTQYADGSILWYIHVASERGGMRAGQTVTVTDLPGDHLQMVANDEFPKLTESDQLGTQGGTTRPVNFRTVPRSQYTVNADNSITFVTKAGYYYEVQYKTKITDGGAAGLYLNKAEVRVDSVKAGETTGQARWSGGSGSGIGTNVGVFEITKKVTGNATIPAERTYTGTYTVTPPSSQPVTGTWTVKADGTWRSATFPRNSTVTLTEDAPDGPIGVTWKSTFDKNDFTLPGGTVTAVTLTNEAIKPKAGSFSLVKAIEGDGAAKVADDTEFTVLWSHPAVNGFPAGAGELKVKADGVVVQSPELPLGAEVSLSEAEPAAVAGAVWRKPTFSEDTFTIGDGTVVAVTLTNTVDLVPPTPIPIASAPPTPTATPTTTPTAPAAPSSTSPAAPAAPSATPPSAGMKPSTPATTTHSSTPLLPQTGAAVGLGAVAIAVLLLLGGSLLLGRVRGR